LAYALGAFYDSSSRVSDGYSPKVHGLAAYNTAKGLLNGDGTYY